MDNDEQRDSAEEQWQRNQMIKEGLEELAAETRAQLESAVSDAARRLDDAVNALDAFDLMNVPAGVAIHVVPDVERHGAIEEALSYAPEHLRDPARTAIDELIKRAAASARREREAPASDPSRSGMRDG